ncbi:MAG: CHAT domain-containing protein [Candidatus Methanosuratincola petrocarbonis]|jgi:CHAT domain-containing protein
MIRTVTILECLPEDLDYPCSEGKMLREYLKIVNFQENNKININYKEISDTKELLFQLSQAKEGCIHISCHGNYDKHGTYLETKGDERLYSYEILCPPPELLSISPSLIKEEEYGDEPYLWRGLDDDDKPVLVFLSSCLTAKKGDLIDAFFYSGCRYVIAPKKVVNFADSAFFTTTFYGLLFWKKMQVSTAFNKAKSLCGDDAKWCIKRKPK